MRVNLMHPTDDFDDLVDVPWNAEDIIQDLELDGLFSAMADGDDLVGDVARKTLLSGLTDIGVIRYRQEILKDSIRNPGTIHELYDLTGEAMDRRKKDFFAFFSKSPSAILYGSTELLRTFTVLLRRLRTIGETQASRFHSDGIGALFAMFSRELGEEYLASVTHALREFRLGAGTLLSAELGDGNKGANYVYRRPRSRYGWRRILGRTSPGYTFRLADRDDRGAKAVARMRDRGINSVANALAQAADHITGFFTVLRTELSFYVGCLNLYAALERRGTPISFPEPVALPERTHRFRGLYDPALALTMDGRPVGSDVVSAEKPLVIITGANQGGKTTFLRSFGIAQLMTQSGMFVPAESCRASIYNGVLTHFRRKEDATMQSGKLDEELQRMSEIVDHVRAGSLVLLNEAFSATNEREGSEIARQVVEALIDSGVSVAYVTHMYELARGFVTRRGQDVLFLRAGRTEDGTRTYRMEVGIPLQTSHGRDLYDRIFPANQNKDVNRHVPDNITVAIEERT